MKKDKNKKTSIKMSRSMTIVCILIGAVSGIVMSSALEYRFERFGFLGELAIKLALLFLAFPIQLVIHEAGHLVAGFISGYSFSSFRIFNIMFVKEGENIKVRKHSVPGTAGQCLMIPREREDGKTPVIFYNLGGALLNIVSIIPSILLANAFFAHDFIYSFFIFVALDGFIVAATNGIPMKLGTINNDGSNARELWKNDEAQRTFCNQFKIIEAITNGKRIAEMPSEWFFMPSDEGMKNSITASGALFYFNRLMDEGRTEEALDFVEKLLSMDSALIGLHRAMLLCEKISLTLILERDSTGLSEIYEDAGLQTFLKQMKTNISIIRAQYAYAKLCVRDEVMASELRARFETFAPKHPYAVEVEGERKILNMIDEIANKG